MWLIVVVLASVLTMVVPAASLGLTPRERSADAAVLSAQARSISELETRLSVLERQVALQPDWTAIARAAQPSVFTIVTLGGLGSGWVARAGPDGSDLVTNFHVVADAWTAGGVMVQVRQGDRTLSGTISQVDRTNDLAVIHVAERFPALGAAASRPQLGEMVIALGSPLGLDGSVSVGVVSRFRSLEGSDYIQFSAPISPGNSGGPVLDHQGRVVAVTVAKFEGQGVEGLSLAIPVQTVCTLVITCQLA